jgi:HD-GYP domain-containing protein (c-di-GMP phosphodiesterase class II)
MSVLAMAVVAVAMAAKGWHAPSLALGAIVALMGALILVQVKGHLCLVAGQADDVRRAAEQAERHYLGVLRRVLQAVEAREQFGKGRSERVGKLCRRISREMGLSERRAELMDLAGQLHDIGLIAVPETLLRKSGGLDREEFRIVKRHSDISFEVLRPLQSLRAVLPAIRHHHERMNGTGYPAGLTGQAIPIEARILAVADAYDAMTHDRPHRAALTPLQAIRELQRCSPDGFDSDVVNVLASILHIDALQSAAGTDRWRTSEPADCDAHLPAEAIEAIDAERQRDAE